jgi:hypothetical protein
MSDSGLLASMETAETPSFSFTKVNRDRTSERYDLDSVTVQGVTADGSPFSKARVPVDEDGRVVISAETFGEDAELAWLVANLLDEAGWEYVEQ